MNGVDVSVIVFISRWDYVVLVHCEGSLKEAIIGWGLHVVRFCNQFVVIIDKGIELVSDYAESSVERVCLLI